MNMRFQLEFVVVNCRHDCHATVVSRNDNLVLESLRVDRRGDVATVTVRFYADGEVMRLHAGHVQRQALAEQLSYRLPS
jgi:hypothetical protein